MRLPKLHIPHPSVVLAGVATALSLMGDQAMYVILPVPEWQGQLGLSQMDVGILLAANRFIRLLTNRWAERLVHKVNATVLFVCVLILGAITTSMYGTWPIMWVMLIGRVLWGLCWSVIRQVAIMTSVDMADKNRVASVIGFYNGVSRCGSIVGMLVAGWLCDSVGFRYCFWAIGATSLLAVVPGALARRGMDGHVSEFRRPRQGGSTDHIRGLLVCGFVIGFVGTGMIVSTLGFVLDHGFGKEIAIGAIVIGIATINGWLLALRYGIMALGGPAFGALLDRIGHRRGAFTFFCIGTGILAAAAVVSLTTNVVMTLILLVFVMVFFVCGTALEVGLITEAGRCGSKAFSWYVSAADLGTACGPLVGWTMLYKLKAPLVPVVVEANAPAALFALCAASFVVGAVVALGRMRGAAGEDRSIASRG